MVFRSGNLNGSIGIIPIGGHVQPRLIHAWR